MKIRIISPAGHTEPDLIDRGAATLRSWGFDVDLSPNAKGRWGRYAATPPQRAQDIIDALCDPTVNILWCSRGGYGSMQLLDRLPLDLIAHARKPLVGYSDITALHALWQKAGTPSVHAPMMRQLAEQPEHAATQKLRAALLHYETALAASGTGIASASAPLRTAKTTDAPWPQQNDLLRLSPHPLDILPERHPSAPIVGGNLAVLSALHGTPYDFDYCGRILFVEDVGESPYKIDRMMQTLRLSGTFDEIRGLIIGQFSGTDLYEDIPTDAAPGQPRLKGLLENIRDLLLPYGIPVRFGAPIGHVVDNHPVVEGAEFTL